MAMIIKSLSLDLNFLLIKRLSVLDKILFLIQKYFVLLGLGVNRSSKIRIKNIRFTTHNLSSLGTLQSSIIDFYSDIICTKIITHENPLIIDVGTNVGQFCSGARLFFSKAQLYSFEPDTNTYSELVVNTKHFNGVKLFSFGLGEKEEDREFYVHNLSLMSSFSKYPSAHYGSADIKSLSLKVLDNVLSSLRKIDLVKVNVEGFERQVISGLKKVLSRAEFLLIEHGLDREAAESSNLSLLSAIYKSRSTARVIKFGGALGKKTEPMCHDSLISLKG